MPTYEYACSACGHQWEQTQRITEAPIEVCPKCSQSKAHRLISATNFILKGGGWYSDLYSSPKPAAASAESSAKTESESPSTDKSEKTDKSDAASTAAPAKSPSTESSTGTGSGGSTSGSSTSTASS